MADDTSGDDLRAEIEHEFAHLDTEDNALFDLVEGGIRHKWLNRRELESQYRLLHSGEIDLADLQSWLEERQGDARYDP